MSEQTKMHPGAGAAASAFQDDDMISIDLVDLFYRLLSSWKQIVCLAVIFAVLSGVYTVYFVTPQYEATAIIYVLSPESILNVSSLQLGTALTSDYIKVFDMWEVHEEVITNLGLDYSYSEMMNRLSVTNSSGTRMLDISFRSPSPSEAASVANEYARVASNYIQETMSTDKPNIMSVALEPANPVSPSRVKNIALGFLAGGALGIAIVVFRFLLDDKIKTAEDIRQCAGLATLAVIPIEGDGANGDAGKKKLSARRKS